ncbi:MAG: phosphatidylglycerol lysyltransferase domain-containing protein [Candidatus Omnitrophica bacterium]|nr:phosphatidylglycerol lysyltransferase domain-containing protein [Candidatus Omnitrophota bacterium]
MSLIPNYPQFVPLDFKHKQFFDAAFKNHPPEISEFTFTNLFSWRRVYGYQVSLLNGLIVLRADAGKPVCFMQPIGSGNLEGSIKQVLDDADGKFCRIPEYLAGFFKNNHSFEVEEDRDNFDYLYSFSDLLNLSGRKYDGKRNQINKFKSEYKYDYVDAKTVDAGQILEFEQLWCSIKGCDMVEGLNNERQAIREITGHLKEFNLNCGVIRLKDRICAVAIAQRLNPETLVMHILKADPGIPGLYQVMLNDFLRANAEDFKYVNLEQDLGVAGLRVFKQSYHPVGLIKKYSISLKR